MARVWIMVAIVLLMVLAATYFAYRLFLAQEQRKAEQEKRDHERRMAREDRDYDELMQYAENDSKDRNDR